MKKVAMIGSIHEDGWKILEEENCEVFEINDFSKKNLIEQLCDVDGIALRTAQLDEEILRKCPKLKIVARHGVGYDSVDLNYLNQNKQALAVTGTSNAVSVAEHVMTMFLCLIKQINKSDNFVKSGKFTEKNELPDFFELYKKIFLFWGSDALDKLWLTVVWVLKPIFMFMILLSINKPLKIKTAVK